LPNSESIGQFYAPTDISYFYLAPEICRTSHNQWVDIYSLGYIVYFMVTGEEAFEPNLHENRKAEEAIPLISLWLEGNFRKDPLAPYFNPQVTPLYDFLRRALQPDGASRERAFAHLKQKKDESVLHAIRRHPWLKQAEPYVYMTVSGVRIVNDEIHSLFRREKRSCIAALPPIMDG